MPRAMRVEYPGAIYHVMDRGDRREDIFVNDVDRQDFVKEPTLPIKWIAARVHIGTAKGAKSVLHHLAHPQPKGNVATAPTPCAQLEFQSTGASSGPECVMRKKFPGGRAVETNEKVAPEIEAELCCRLEKQAAAAPAPPPAPARRCRRS